MNLTIGDIEKILSSYSKFPDKQARIRTFAIDSRKVKSGDVFVAIQGQNTDGHKYVNDALHKGALVAIIEKGSCTNCIYVPQTINALGKLARSFAQENNFKVIGITGSIGKTTTKQAACSVLNSGFKVGGSIGNMNTEIGLPLSVLSAPGNTDMLVLEMGARNQGDINYLCNIVKIEMGVITRIAPVHLENFKTIDNIIKTKCEIIDNLNTSGVGLLNSDDTKLKELGKKFKNIEYFGCEAQNVQSIKYNSQGTEIDIKGEGHYFIPILGETGLYAMLAAIKIGQIYGLDYSQIKSGLEQTVNSPGRLKLEKIGNLLVIDDSYNSNPVALSSALKLSKKFKANRYIAVLGDMKELGEEENYYHILSGIEVGNMKFDYLIAVGEKADLFQQGAVKSGITEDKIYTSPDWEHGYQQLKQIIQPEDLVLIKASRAVQLDKLVSALKGGK